MEDQARDEAKLLIGLVVSKPRCNGWMAKSFSSICAAVPGLVDAWPIHKCGIWCTWQEVAEIMPGDKDNPESMEE